MKEGMLEQRTTEGASAADQRNVVSHNSKHRRSVVNMSLERAVYVCQNVWWPQASVIHRQAPARSLGAKTLNQSP